MRRLLFIQLFILLACTVFAQSTPEKPSIGVIGSAKLTIKPDLGVLIIGVKNLNLSFSEAITGLNTKTKDISNQIASIGFKPEEIKTTDFKTEVNTVYRKEENVDSGYVATQSIRVEFKNDKETITKILNTFSKSQTDFTLSFDFKLSDELRAKVQDELIDLSVKDSKRKAQLIAKSSGVRLGKIKDINYGNSYYGNMQELEDKATVGTSAAAGAFVDPLIGFTPNDLEFIDSVFISWLLK